MRVSVVVCLWTRRQRGEQTFAAVLNDARDAKPSTRLGAFVHILQQLEERRKEPFKAA